MPQERYRTYSHSHPARVQYNNVCRMLDARSKAAKRRAGIYDPVNGKNYPMPEDGTESIDRKLTAFYWGIRERAYQRCVKDAPIEALI